MDNRIFPRIDTKDFPRFELALVTEKSAIYTNPGEDILVLDRTARNTVMEKWAAENRYSEEIHDLLYNNANYEYLGAMLMHYLPMMKKCGRFE